MVNNMLEEKAKLCVCPFRVDSDGGLDFCYGSRCMAWVDYTINNKPDEKSNGHCALIYGE